MPYQPAVLGSARLNNFRLDYVPAALDRVRDWRLGFFLDGEPVRHRVRVGSVEIRDILNDAPNTAQWRMQGTPPPEPGMQVRITINSNAPQLLFNGTVNTTALTYEGKPAQVVYACTAIDDTTRADNRRPFGLYQNVSASTVVTDLVARFAPGLTAAHVQPGLAPVTVAFDGTEGFNGCLRAICRIIGAYFYWEDGDLHFFLQEATAAPDPLTPTTRTLYHDPPIAATTDDSQVRTRVYGRGYGSTLLLDVPATETILPVANATLFTPTGGKLIASTTADGSPTDRLAYTGVNTSGTATVVGPGVTPGSAPVLTLQAGAGLAAGVYAYAYTWVTPSGETLLSATTAITISGVLDPPGAMAALSLAPGNGLAVGTYRYVTTFLNGAGETTPGAPATIATAALAGPTVAPTASSYPAGSFPGRSPGAGWPAPGDTVVFVVANFDATGGQTIQGPASAPFIAQHSGTVGWTANMSVNFPAETAPGVAYRAAYMYRNGGYSGYSYFGPAGAGFSTASHNVGDVMGWFGGQSFTPPQAPIAVATAYRCRVNVPLAIGPAGTTGRRIYRSQVNASNALLWTTVGDNTTSTALDGSPDAALGAAAPVVNTATMARVLPSGIGLGPGATTSRKLYRTIANGAQFKLQQTIANNTATTGVVDTTVDGSLGATAPITDTAGLTQPAGQVPAGSSTLLTAGAPFPSTGGYVLVGGLPVRYTGLTGNTLTGIPPTGAGALLVPVNYGTPVILAPSLTGVTGLIQPLAKGAAVHIFVQRDDVTAQAAAAGRESTATYIADGIHEHMLTDERRAEPSLTARCDADLLRFGAPLVTVQYVSADVQTKSGKPIAIALPTPAITATLVIQDVTITQLDIADGVPARFATTASSVKFSLEDLLRRMSALLPE